MFQTTVDVRARHHNLQGNVVSYDLVVQEPEMVVTILKAIKLLDDQGRIQTTGAAGQMRLVQNSCCKRAFLRGAFLVAGSVTNPQKAYHLEIAVISDVFARQLQK